MRRIYKLFGCIHPNLLKGHLTKSTNLVPIGISNHPEIFEWHLLFASEQGCIEDVPVERTINFLCSFEKL